MAKVKTTLTVVEEPEKAGGTAREAAKEEAKRKRVRSRGAERDGAERLRQAADQRIVQRSQRRLPICWRRGRRPEICRAPRR